MSAAPLLVEVNRSYRRTLLVSAGCGLAAVVAFAALGNWGAGVAVCVGLALGAYNGRLVQSSALRLASSNEPDRRRRFVLSVFTRLAGVSLVALYAVFAFRHSGWGLLIGLALFQLVLLGSSSGPMLREMRKA